MQQTPARLPFAVQPTGTSSILYGVGAGVLTVLLVMFGLAVGTALLGGILGDRAEVSTTIPP